MQQSAVALDDQTILQVRLQRFMNWLLAAFATLAVLMTIMLLRVPTLNRMLGTASAYVLVIVLLVARLFLARRPAATVMTISVGFFCLAMADVVLLPRAARDDFLAGDVYRHGTAISQGASAAQPQHRCGLDDRRNR
jgi:hypothetical protein